MLEIFFDILTIAFRVVSIPALMVGLFFLVKLIIPIFKDWNLEDEDAVQAEEVYEQPELAHVTHINSRRPLVTHSSGQAVS